MIEPISDPSIGLIAQITPAAPLIVAGLLAAATPVHAVRKVLSLAAPVLALAMWLNAEFGVYGRFEILGLDLETFRFDGLSRIFGLAFILAAFLNAIYALHNRSRVEDAAALIYSGAGVGAVFAGDFLTLFVFWELTAISSVFLIWARGGESSTRAGLRYLAIHVGSGVLLLGGAVIWATSTGDWRFSAIEPGTAGGLMILIAFGIKAAFPLLHNWLQDAYPKSTVVGAVVLSAVTTKLAVYALARGFAGYEPLIYIGAVMTVFPVFFAVVENDLRRVLSYSLNNQVGFMVCAIGVGTTLAVNGAAAHAFVHIIYKALLFMTMGAVLHRTGTVRASDLGGLYKTMPFTAIFCIIGALSISAFPLLSGFVAKALILTAVAKEGYWVVWAMLLFASAGVLEHSGIKIPYFAFFAHDSGRRPKEAPTNMLIAMAAAAFVCIYLGVDYGWLYRLLPFQPETGPIYEPYTLDHVLTQMQLLVAAAFAFSLLMRLKVYPPERRGVILDTDWVYRRFGDGVARWGAAVLARLWAHIDLGLKSAAKAADARLHALFSPAGVINRAVPNGVLAIWTALILGFALLVSYLA